MYFYVLCIVLIRKFMCIFFSSVLMLFCIFMIFFFAGFSGDLCNFEYNECDSNPCINGGQCIDHIGGFSCQCSKGYQGKRCHIKVNKYL